jgi:hypothetical protein
MIGIDQNWAFVTLVPDILIRKERVSLRQRMRVKEAQLSGNENSILTGHAWRKLCAHGYNYFLEIFTRFACIIRYSYDLCKKGQKTSGTDVETDVI